MPKKYFGSYHKPNQYRHTHQNTNEIRCGFKKRLMGTFLFLNEEEEEKTTIN